MLVSMVGPALLVECATALYSGRICNKLKSAWAFFGSDSAGQVQTKLITSWCPMDHTQWHPLGLKRKLFDKVFEEMQLKSQWGDRKLRKYGTKQLAKGIYCIFVAV